MIPIEEIVIAASVLLLAAVLASKASAKLGVPALLLFLIIGMLAGSEGPGGIPFDDARLTQAVGVVALAFILFAGGLETDWSSVSRVVWRALSLSTLGVAITAVLIGWFATLVLHFSWLEGLLLGSIVSSTDAAAVFSILRSRGAILKANIGPLLELESGSNDPMALIVLLGRNDDFVVPRGGTVIQGGDTLLVLSNKEDIGRLRAMVDPAGVSVLNPEATGSEAGGARPQEPIS